jgi:agmatinase
MTKKEKIAAFDPNGVGLDNGHFIGLPFEENDASIFLLGVPWDVTVSYRAGTHTAPENILNASTQLDLFDPHIADAWKLGIYFQTSDPDWKKRNAVLRPKAAAYIEFLEKGGNPLQDSSYQHQLQEVNEACWELRFWVKQTSLEHLEKGQIVGVVGGDHSTPLGLLDALGEQHGSFGVLQIDAHQDLRKAYEGFTYSHASIFYNALQSPQIERLVQVGIRDYCEEEWQLAQSQKDRIHTYPDHLIKNHQYNGETFYALCREVVELLPQKVYISFDIDGLDPHLCPNTGTPVPGGLDFSQALFLIQTLVESGRTIIGFDLCEVGGLGNEWDGNVGARILYRLSNWAGRSNGLI